MCVCVIDKALPQVLYFAYSMSEGSALSGIENCQLEIHIRHMKQLETHRVVLSSVRIGIVPVFYLCCTVLHLLSSQ